MMILLVTAAQAIPSSLAYLARLRAAPHGEFQADAAGYRYDPNEPLGPQPLKPEEKAALDALAKRNGPAARLPVYTLARRYRGGYRINYNGNIIKVTPRPPARNAGAVLERGLLYFNNVRPGLDALYLPALEGLETLYLVKRRPGPPLRQLIECRNGTPSLSGDGKLLIGGLSLSKPVIYDAAGKKADGEYRLSEARDGRALVELIYDRPGLAYPLLID
ncbi:MAG: hypothetical protein JW873_01315 [Candidatus Saganbacteria bacterium]|nr:hypothetical protein [Candidatus Saganbacteria bacterium]